MNPLKYLAIFATALSLSSFQAAEEVVGDANPYPNATITPDEIESRGNQVREAVAAEDGVTLNDTINIDHETILDEAVSRGDFDAVYVLLHAGADVNFIDERNLSPLAVAISDSGTPNPAMISTLILKGANPNLKLIHGWTALHLAACHNRVAASVILPVIQALIDGGADLEEQSDDGRTAYDLAVENRMGTNVLELLEPQLPIKSATKTS